MFKRLMPVRWVIFWWVVSFLPLGCQNYPFEELHKSVIKEYRWSQVISVSSAADILFVVDNSGSMGGEQDQLGRSFEAFATELESKFGDNYRIAIITTGMESPLCPQCDTLTVPGSCINETQENGRFQDRLGQIVQPGDPPEFDFTTDPSCRVVTSENKECFYDIDQNKGIALVGVEGCGFERGLASLKPALKNLRGSHNAGFLRDDATLVVVIISDEDDCGEVGDVWEESSDGGNICYFAAKGVGPEGETSHSSDEQRRPYALTPVEHYYDFLVNDVKGGRKGMVKFAAIVGVENKDDLSTTEIKYEKNLQGKWEVVHACTTAGCTGRFCYAEPSTRYIKLAQMFGIDQNGFVDTICQNDFSQTMKDLGNFVACPRKFKLNVTPLDPDLASILINGEDVPLYSCSIPGRLEICDGPGTSCSQGSCVRTWRYCDPADPNPPQECQCDPGDLLPYPDCHKAAGGIIVFANHYDPCDLITEGEIHIEFVFVPRD